MAEYDLGTAHGTVHIEYEGDRSLAQVLRDLRKVEQQSDRSTDKVGKFGKSLDKLVGFAAKAGKAVGVAALAVNTLHNAALLVAGTLATIGPIAAAGLATLPGIIAGGVAAMAVFKIATLGVGDAIKAAGGDQEKFNEAIKNLSPNAQAFAKSVRAATQVLKPMQQAMQNAFFAGTDKEVAKITKQVSGLRPQAVGVADAFNQVVRRVLEFGSSIPAVVAVREVLKGVRAFLLAISAGVTPVLTGFARLANQASVFGGSLGNAIALAMIKFGEFLSKVNLAVVFENAMKVLQPLGTLLGNIGTIIGAVFGGLTVDAGGALGVFGELTGQLATFLQSIQGQEALNALGQAMATISGQVGQVFLTLLQQLAPIVVALAPGFVELVTQLAGALIPALETAGPLLTDLAQFLSDNMSWLGPVAGAVLVLVGAYKAYNVAAGVWSAIEKANIGTRAAAVGSWIASKAAVVGSTVALVANRVAMVANTIAGWVANTAAIVANTVASVAARVAMLAVRAAVIAWTAVQWLLNAALLANPIGLIILAIVALIAIIVLIATKTTWFQDIWSAVWGWIKEAASAVGNWFANTLWPLIKQVWDFIKNLIMAHVNAIKDIFLSIWGVIQRVINFFAELRAAILGKIGEALSFIRELPGRIQDALGNLGSLLFNKGKELVQGFINGIKNMFGQAAQTAKNLVNTVMDFLPGSPAKKGPLSKKGWTPFRGKALVEGLAEGMQSQISRLQKVAATVALTAAPVVPTAVGGAGTSLGSIPKPAPAVAAPAPAESSVNIERLDVTVQGVLDMSDPQAARQIAVKINDAIEKVKKEYK